MFSFSIHKDYRQYSELMLQLSSFNSLCLMKINADTTDSGPSPAPLGVCFFVCVGFPVGNLPHDLLYIIPLMLGDLKTLCEAHPELSTAEVYHFWGGRKEQGTLCCAYTEMNAILQIGTQVKTPCWCLS